MLICIKLIQPTIIDGSNQATIIDDSNQATNANVSE